MLPSLINVVVLLDERQVAATRLGNAIRRFEEHGHHRYRLDSQVLWHELNAVVPEPVRKQVEDGRTNVDFFVSLLCGHVLVAVAAAVDLIAGRLTLPVRLAVEREMLRATGDFVGKGPTDALDPYRAKPQ
ncbi:hypothetical protein ABZU76_14290 [Amycolatopsis sp. NPDC005232]|uniref:hypothetical protein n=1 Tax=Amycolatopsis sp. NPDC005232 TaxID=3157027 RepID=UPI0033B10218